MSWQQHYYGGAAAGATKCTPSPAAAQQAGHGMDYSQDLHLKMSKKIAQLTKVRAGWRWVRRRLGAGPAGLTCPAGRLRALRRGPVARGCNREATAGDLPPKTVQTSGESGNVHLN